MWVCFFQTTIFQSLIHLHLSCTELARIIFHNRNKCHLLCVILLGRVRRLNSSSKGKKRISFTLSTYPSDFSEVKVRVRFFFFFTKMQKKCDLCI